MNLARDVKGDKKGFCKYLNCKRKTRENTGMLWTGAVALVPQGMEKAELLNALFTSFFASKTDLQKSKALEIKGKVWSKEHLPLVEEDQVREYFSNLDIHKSMGCDGK